MGRRLVRDLRGRHTIALLGSGEAWGPPLPKVMSPSAQMPALQKQRQMR